MKRSTMLNEMTQMIEKHKECCSSPNLALMILMKMEELGMRPPLYDFNELVYSDDWQNEDETINNFIIRDPDETGN